LWSRPVQASQNDLKNLQLSRDGAQRPEKDAFYFFSAKLHICAAQAGIRGCLSKTTREAELYPPRQNGARKGD
jgi:hypothetical protein